ncbi:MAG: hypothetical protein GY950_02435 [bacterium]|nr:hypothetical protein [bacterium]
MTTEFDIVMQTFDCVIPDGEGSYLAGPISTGRRFQEALSENNVTSMPELIASVGMERYLDQVRWPNVKEGKLLAAEIRAGGERFLINTGPLLIEQWEGQRYMDLCFALIKKKVKKLYFHPEWAFSSGAVQEYIFAVANNLPRLRPGGQELGIPDALEDLQNVKEYLFKLGLSSNKTDGYIHRLSSS